MNKKGFTLVELISVLVILILLFLFAVTTVKKHIDSSEKKATVAAAQSLFRTTSNFATINNNEQGKDKIFGLYTVDALYDLGLKLDGKKPTGGYVYIYDDKVVSGCIEVGENKVNYVNGKVKNAIEGKCTNPSGYNKVTKTYNFDYSGEEETISLSNPGKYIIEAWGASGGNANDTYVGGAGAYSRVEYSLLENEEVTLYINVGGEGKGKCNRTNCVGGYNGGSDTGSGSDSAIYYGAGGGATSIALVSGTLSTLESNKDKILLVAAGGGGASYVNSNTGNNGGAGGGYVGNNSLTNSVSRLYYGSGGTQENGGSSSFTSSNQGAFGQGGTFVSAISNVASAGAGGGYYGGGYAGGGGSGYTPLKITLPTNSREVTLSDHVMVCHKCHASNITEWKTLSTDNTNKDAVSNVPKIGNGFVRITPIID